MKKIGILFLFFLAIAMGCNSSNSDKEQSNDHNDGTHTHEDGALHQNHDSMQQEEFNATADSSLQNTEEHSHTHGDDQKHNH